MRRLVFLLEELSARDLLKGLLPRILPDDIQVQYLVFEGKQDLERQLVRKLRTWLAPSAMFVVLRDQDAAECTIVKQNLLKLVQVSGRTDVLVSVACHELESWVLGDFEAVAKAFGKPQLRTLSRKAAYRQPDRLANPVTELRKILPDYQKRDGARRIGPLLDPDRNQSQSFHSFCTGLQKLIGKTR